MSRPVEVRVTVLTVLDRTRLVPPLTQRVDQQVRQLLADDARELPDPSDDPEAAERRETDEWLLRQREAANVIDRIGAGLPTEARRQADLDAGF